MDGRRIAVIVVALLVVLALVLALVLSVFGGGSSSGPPKTVGTFDPEIKFVTACLPCHGSSGRAPHLSGALLTKTFPNIEDQIKFVENGNGAMPAQKDSFTPNEIRQIVEYTRTLP